MKALVLAYGDGRAASTTYRYGACQKLWADDGHELTILSAANLPEDFWARVKNFDVIISQKALLSVGFCRRLVAVGPPVFFDFDDAIWTRPKRPYSWWTQWRVNRRIRCWFRAARRIVAANQHLADFARLHNRRVEVLPMALDLDVWRPAPPRNLRQVRIGWAGGPANLWHLENLREPLRRLLQANPTVKLAVFCGQPPKLDLPLDYIPFAPGKEPEFIAGLDVGLLPLQYETYTLGKSPIKALQYMSCAVPVVGNVAGATAEILHQENSFIVKAPEEWLPALQRLVDSPAERAQLGAAGRRFIEQRHDLRRVSARLIELLSGAK
jgi:glycosyltransferase involved in cell wall biosynthesis